MKRRMSSGHSWIIGVDFDNTIVTYDEIFYNIALERGLISSSLKQGKKRIRDQIRKLPDGEIEWQKLQAIVYGPRISEARLVGGVGKFFALCRSHHIDIWIISHKTEHANYDEIGTNLRVAALGWMKANQFFQTNGFGFSPTQVCFESTRQEKIARIRQLGCTHFIDDLEETFHEKMFPSSVEKILYSPYSSRPKPSGMKVMASWQEICEYFFTNRN